MSRLVVYLVAASVLIAWASAACNTKEATELDSGDCNCTDSSLVYDYRENVCKDESDLYSYDGFGPFGNASGCYSGFITNSTTGWCDDVDECYLGSYNCSSSGVCYNTPGKYYCGCGDQYYNNPSGKCDNFDESLNPLWNDCPQLVYDRSPGYKCVCFNTTMFDDTLGDGKSCVLNPGYEYCRENTDKGVMCVEETATGKQTFFPIKGYQLNDNNASEDKNECMVDSAKPLCWSNAECQNIMDGGGYLCSCKPGYTDEIFTGTIKECVPVNCSRGEGLACVDACDDYRECQQDEYCVLQNNLPTNTSQLADAIFYKPLSENLFYNNNSIVIWNPKESPSQVTQSLEMVFGAGNVQLLPQSPQSDTFTLHVVLNMTQSGVLERLNSYCRILTQLPGYCELPAGVIIKNVTTEFTLVEDVCAEDTCPSATHVCADVNRTCNCRDGGTGAYFNVFMEICEYRFSNGSDCQTTTVKASSTEQVSQTTTVKASSTEQVSQTTTVKASSTEQISSSTEEVNWKDVATDLQEQLKDADEALKDTEDSLKVTGAVLGTLLGLSLVIIVVLVFFKKGRFFSG